MITQDLHTDILHFRGLCYSSDGDFFSQIFFFYTKPTKNIQINNALLLLEFFINHILLSHNTM